MTGFAQPELHPRLARRQLLCIGVAEFHRTAIGQINNRQRVSSGWRVSLGDNLLFDRVGLEAISQAIENYRGTAARLSFKLSLSREAIRDYYSHSSALDPEGGVHLPVSACRVDSQDRREETLTVTLRELTTDIGFPTALCPPDKNSTPLGLLLPCTCDHDLLFANQIAIFSQLNQRVPRALGSLIRGVFSSRKLPLRQRTALSWRTVGKDSDIHPSAVVEGSVIGRGCRIGAHCVVRHSVIGDGVQLHDGAKVEYSVIGEGSWLMHDLVLYRCLVERDVFLIHGPYQFSYFMHHSAAFACIMMDYRPDAKAIGIATDQGVRRYQGRFLGALLEENAKVLGGTLTAPGITIPAGREICVPTDQVTRPRDLG